MNRVSVKGNKATIVNEENGVVTVSEEVEVSKWLVPKYEVVGLGGMTITLSEDEEGREYVVGDFGVKSLDDLRESEKASGKKGLYSRFMRMFGRQD